MSSDLTLAPGPAAMRPPSARAALAFVLEMPGARQKLFVAALLSLLPIVGWIAVQGWIAEGARRLLRHHPDPLPPIAARDLGHYLREGAAPWAVGYLGGFAVSIVVYVVALLFNLIGLAAALTAGAIAPLIAWAGAGAVLLLAVGAVATLYGSAAMTRAALGAGFADALAPAGAWRLTRAQRLRVLGSHAALAPIVFVILVAGALLCGVGLLPALVVAQISAMHLGVQHYERYRALGGPSLESPPALLPSERKQLPP